jgi:hypothetical protein
MDKIEQAFDDLRQHAADMHKTHGMVRYFGEYEDSYVLGYMASYLESFVRGLPEQYQKEFMNDIAWRVDKKTREEQEELAIIEMSIRAELDALDLPSEDRKA